MYMYFICIYMYIKCYFVAAKVVSETVCIDPCNVLVIIV